MHSKRRKKVMAQQQRLVMRFCLALGRCLFEILGLQKYGVRTPLFQGRTGAPGGLPPPYRVAIDAGHGEMIQVSPRCWQESQMTVATAAALMFYRWRKDPHYIPLNTRGPYTTNYS